MTNDIDITRYRFSDGWDNYGYPCHRQDGSGTWVEYKDHSAIVEKLKQEVSRLETKLSDTGGDYSDGFDDGYDTAIREMV